MGEVVRFQPRGTRGPRAVVARSDGGAEIHILPAVRIERHGDEQGFALVRGARDAADQRMRLR